MDAKQTEISEDKICKYCKKIIPKGGHHTLWVDGSCIVFNPIR